MADNIQHFEFIITEEWEDERIDKCLGSLIDSISRSYLQKLLLQGQVSVNGIVIQKANYRLRLDDKIVVCLPPAIVPEIIPENIPLNILYEDQDVIVVNKPKGMVVHPAPGHYSGTLVNALLYHCPNELSGINGVMRPGIVHRIDRDTTGSVIACKNDRAHAGIAEQLKSHTIIRRYHAIVVGNLKEEEGTIHTLIGRSPSDRKKMAVVNTNGKEAVTHYRVLQHFHNYTYIECVLETGRTHQIRVHMSHIGHPILGDAVYGSSTTPFQLDGQTLHAKILGFHHPIHGNYIETNAPLPSYFTKLLNILS